MTNTKTLIEMLTYYIESGKETVEAFLVKVKKNMDENNNPLHCFEWSKEEFEAAAKVWVYSRVLASLNKDAPLDSLYKKCLEEALHFAKSPKTSTSAPANFAAQCEGSAWAEVTELLKGAIENNG